MDLHSNSTTLFQVTLVAEPSELEAQERTSHHNINPSTQPLLIINKMLIKLIPSKNLTPHKPMLLIKSRRLAHSLTRLCPQHQPPMLPRNMFQRLQNHLRNTNAFNTIVASASPAPLRHSMHPLHLRLPRQSLFSERAQATTTYGLGAIVGYEEDWDVGGVGGYSEACGAQSGDFELLRVAVGGGVGVGVEEGVDC